MHKVGVLDSPGRPKLPSNGPAAPRVVRTPGGHVSSSAIIPSRRRLLRAAAAADGCTSCRSGPGPHLGNCIFGAPTAAALFVLSMASSAAEGTVTLNFVNADIDTVVKAAAKSPAQFVLDPRSEHGQHRFGTTRTAKSFIRRCCRRCAYRASSPSKATA
jgi:hypothetical protein